jgi:MFS family permease
MVGDGVEAGFLSPLLIDLHFSSGRVALVFNAYGVAAAISSWLSGALSDIFGPKNVMWAGLLISLLFELPFLSLGIAHANHPIILVSYALRGFGYPLFAYGFLVWITSVTPRRYLGTAVGWFWSARTGGLPTLGALFASFAVPRLGMYATLRASVFMVLAGGLLALLGIQEKHGAGPLAKSGQRPLALLVASISIAWRRPKVGLGASWQRSRHPPSLAFLSFYRSFLYASSDSHLSSGCRF